MTTSYNFTNTESEEPPRLDEAKSTIVARLDLLKHKEVKFASHCIIESS